LNANTVTTEPGSNVIVSSASARIRNFSFGIVLAVLGACNFRDPSDSLYFQCEREGGRTETIRIDETDLEAENLSYSAPFSVTDLKITASHYEFAFEGRQTYRYRFHRATGEGLYESFAEDGQFEPRTERLSCRQVPREGLVIAR
jgi:hypothetical protein